MGVRTPNGRAFKTHKTYLSRTVNIKYRVLMSLRVWYLTEKVTTQARRSFDFIRTQRTLLDTVLAWLASCFHIIFYAIARLASIFPNTPFTSSRGRFASDYFRFAKTRCQTQNHAESHCTYSTAFWTARARKTAKKCHTRAVVNYRQRRQVRFPPK